MSVETTITRRGSLKKLGGLAATLFGIGAIDTGGAEAQGTGPAAVASGVVKCVLTPEMTEGPYYIAGEKVRRDIREGHPGTKLTLRLRVLDASTCKPRHAAMIFSNSAFF